MRVDDDASGIDGSKRVENRENMMNVKCVNNK